MSSGEEAIRKDIVGSELSEEPSHDDSETLTKPPSTEENLPKGDDSGSQDAPKVVSEAIDKIESPENKKSEESEREVATGSSVTSEMKKPSVEDDGNRQPVSEDKPSEDKGSLTGGSGSSLQSSEGKSGPNESARNSLPSSDGNSDSYESARDACPLLGESISSGYIRISRFTASTGSLTLVPVVDGNGLKEHAQIVSQPLGDCNTGENEAPSEEEAKKTSDESASIPSEENKPSADETTETLTVQSADGSTDKSVSGNNGKIVGDDNRSPLPASPVAVEDGQKRKAAQSGATKRFLGLSFGSKSADKPKTPKKSSASDKIKSPKKKSDVPDEPSETPKSPKKSDDPDKPSEETKSPKESGAKPKKSKSSKKSDGLNDSTDKIKSPEKPDKIDDPLKKSKKCSEPEKVKSPKKSSGAEKVKSPKKSSSSESSKKRGEQKESTTETPTKQSSALAFLHGVKKNFFQKLSPGDPKETKRPICSSACNPDFHVRSPELSPIGNERHFSASYLGNFIFPSESRADRIDYSKLAEERIIATFLTSHECYDVIPISGKIIVLSVDLLVKNAFSALVTNEINAAPLWDSGLHDFVGFLTITDFINVLRHYFYSSPEDIKDIENQSISTWRRITKVPNRFVKINGSKSLSEAARLLVQEGVHRIPVFDEKRQVVLFVLTRKRLLQYLSSYLFDKLDQFNIKTPTFFKKTLREVGVGTYEKIATVTETAKVIDALDLFVNRGVSSLPVVDEDGVIKDIFGKMDVFALAKEQMYHNLDITVYEVIRKNVPRECAFICTLDDSFGTVIQRFISTKSHRMVVIDDIRSVVGIISLSDLLKFLVLEPLAAMALDAGAGNASDIIEEGAEGAVGGADVDAVFNDDSVNVTGESSKDESLALTSMKDLNISKDNEVEPVTEAVLKSE